MEALNYAGLAPGGALIARITAANNTNSTLVKAGEGRLVGAYLHNKSAAASYVKIYNKATAPTVGTDVPAFIIGIPAASSVHLSFPGGISFILGLGYGIVTGVGDADATAPAAADVNGALFYA